MNQKGRLLVRVFTSRAQIPLEGATVAITQDKTHLLALKITDSSGNIPPISLPTPEGDPSTPSLESLEYSLCDVWAEHSGYELLLAEGVQIFPGVDTVQHMMLLPRAEHALGLP